jgi:hypothetical protein
MRLTSHAPDAASASAPAARVMLGIGRLQHENRVTRESYDATFQTYEF